MGTAKNRLIEEVRLSTLNTCLNGWVRLSLRPTFFILTKFPSQDVDEDDMQVPIPTICYTCKFQNWLKLGLKYQNIMNWRLSKTGLTLLAAIFVARKQFRPILDYTYLLIYVLRKVGIDTILEWLCAK